MTDLDTLRRALQAPARDDLSRPHIGQIMARGRRLRRRRRALAACGAIGGTGLAAVLVVTITGIGQPRRPAIAPREMPPLSALGPTHRGAHSPYGTVIGTRVRNAAGELVFYAVRVHLAGQRGITFGVMAGYRQASGRLTADVLANEYTGSDKSPGFHAVEGPMTVNGREAPQFGYYAGPAATITGTVSGHLVHASHAHWSVNPRIVIFWFPPSTNPTAATITGLTAHNTHGQQLPPGNNNPSVG
jgi:hypothetical protein